MQLLSVTATVSFVFAVIAYTQLRVISSKEGFAGICLLQATARAATALSQVTFCDPKAFNWIGCVGRTRSVRRVNHSTLQAQSKSSAVSLLASSFQFRHAVAPETVVPRR